MESQMPWVIWFEEMTRWSRFGCDFLGVWQHSERRQNQQSSKQQQSEKATR